MTPRFLVEAVPVSMLSSKWMLGADLALPRTSQRWGRDLPHLCSLSLMAMRADSDANDLKVSMQ